MLFAARLNYKQKSFLTQIALLFILSVVIPFFNGTQIWPGDYATIFSLVLLTCFMLPSIILFYRWLLPFTIGRKRIGLFLLLLVPYLIVYEINARLSSIAGIHLSIFPERYRRNLAAAHPQDFSVSYINQTLEYTVFVLFAASCIYFVTQAYKKQYQLYVLENDKLRLELNQLKSQLQPHFFFNTLNNLYALSIAGSSQTSPMIVNLSNIMRYVLYESEQDKVSLEKEIDFIKNYIDLEKIRLTDVNVVFDLQGTITNVEIEPLLFLPLVENAFKHSDSAAVNKTIKLVLDVDEHELTFQVTNGCIENPGIEKNTGGIGLKNLKKRLQLLYPDRHQLNIEKHDGSFNIFLNLRFVNKQ